ncbi:MAG: 4Fe-4S binding protein [Proteobacteria bacterium]|nr:4Fe-4S binding protein [Pseudomonadota bacterium]
MIGCPTGAISRTTEGGMVVINDISCIGCGTCANSCPYDNIRLVPIREKNGQQVLDPVSREAIGDRQGHQMRPVLVAAERAGMRAGLPARRPETGGHPVADPPSGATRGLEGDARPQDLRGNPVQRRQTGGTAPHLAHARPVLAVRPAALGRSNGPRLVRRAQPRQRLDRHRLRPVRSDPVARLPEGEKAPPRAAPGHGARVDARPHRPRHGQRAPLLPAHAEPVA